MPGYKGHLAGGIVAYALALVVVRYVTSTPLMPLEWFICTLAGALFPDIDIKSKGQKIFYWSVLMLLFSAVAWGNQKLFILLGACALVPFFVNHRGIFHRLWFVIGLPCCIAFVMSMSMPHYMHVLTFDTLFFVAGAVSHLWLDFGVRRMLFS